MNALPKGWTTIALGDVAKSAGEKAGAVTASPVYSVTKHLGFVPSADYFKKQVYSRDLSSYKRVQRGDFAYATIHLDEGSIGIAPEEALISPMYTAFNLNTELVEPGYLLKFMKSPRALAQYALLGSGSVHRRRAISFKRISELQIPLPPLDEQRRIAAILDKASSLVEDWDRGVGRTSELIPSIFDAVPNEGSQYRLSELGDFSGGITLGPKRNGSTKRLPYLRVANVMRGHLELDEIKSAGVTEKEAHTKSLRRGDLLIVEGHGRLGEIGRTAMWQNEIPAITHQNHLFRLRCEQSTVLPEYLMGYLNSSAGRRAIQRLATTTSGLNTLSGKKLKTLQVPVPDIDTQTKYVSRYTQARKRILALHGARTRAQSLLKSLRSRAFRGEL